MSALDKVDTIPFWKKIYQTASGYSSSVTNDIVQEILDLSGTELKAGFAIYKPFKQEEFNVWEKTCTGFDADLVSFINRLCKNLNLAPEVVLPVFFNYLMFEYYGKIEEMKLFIIFEENILKLLKSVWEFYTAERMYYIKTLRHIFECAIDSSNSYKEEYVKFIQNVNLTKFRQMLISQFKNLIGEITAKGFELCCQKTEWVNRNNREQVEFLLLIITTTEYMPLNRDEFTILVNTFLLHNFTRQPLYFDTTLYGIESDFNDVKAVEIGCFLIGINQIGKDVLLSLENMEVSLKNIQSQGNHIIVLFAWAFAKLKYLDGKCEEDIKKYENMIINLIKRGIFAAVNDFLSAKVLKAKTRPSKIISVAAYHLLDEFLINFEAKDIFFHDLSLLTCVDKFLDIDEIAERMLIKREGFDVVVKKSFEFFPFEFVAFVKFVGKLMKLSSVTSSLISQMNRMISFKQDVLMMYPNTSLASSESSEELEGRCELGFELGKRLSSVSVYDDIFNASDKYSFISYLECLTEKALFYLKRHSTKDLQLEIPLGFELIFTAIYYFEGNISSCNFGNCLSLLHQFVLLVNNEPLKYSDVIKVYFKICAAMILKHNSSLKRQFPDNKFGKPFLPRLNIKDAVPKVLARSIMDSVLFQVLHKEDTESTHSTVSLYLDFLIHFAEAKRYTYKIQLPGLVYVVNYVFPLHMKWSYEELSEQKQITIKCLRLFLFILQGVNVKVEKETILYDFVFKSLLKNPFILETVLQCLFRKNFHLQTLMQNEVDWLHGETLEEITMSKMNLSVFLHLASDPELTELLKPKLPIVTKCIASFITNAFSSSLANVACRMLEKLSRDNTIPLLALLEMDYSQIQCLFLEKLRDPLEEDTLKITVLDFINTSLLSQNGLTAAFFNAPDIFQSKAEVEQKPTDSVCDFMIDYLQNIQKSREFLSNPVQKSIIRLFATLWSTGRENLIADIYKLKKFWSLLTDPLFHIDETDQTVTEDPEVYTYIMTIVTIHISNNINKVDENLNEVLKKIFDDEKLIDNWTNYITRIAGGFVEGKDCSKKLSFLSTWQKFMIVVKCYLPGVLKKDQIKCKIITSCLSGILAHFSNLLSNEVITTMFDTYMILIFAWPDVYKKELNILELLTTVLSTYVSRCSLVNMPNREVILTLIYKTVTDTSEMLVSHPFLLRSLLKCIGIIMDFEYSELQREHEDAKTKVRSIMCWVLVARVGDSVLSLPTINSFAPFFKYNQYLSRMLESVKFALSDVQTLPMVKMLMETLIVYAESDIAIDFLAENVTVIYDIVNPMRPVFPNTTKDELPIYLKEQWILYRMVVKLNHILLKKFGEQLLEENFSFITVHDRVFAQIISLSQYTVDNKAMDLSCETLTYLHSIFDWVQVWSVKYPNSFSLIVDSIKMTVNTCISTILRPQNIHFYEISKLAKLTSMDEVPNGMVIDVVDRFMELLCLATRCLIKCNPRIDKLLDFEKPKCPLYVLLEQDFAVPKFDIPVNSNLTYGRLLCMIHYLCKILTQKSTTTKPSTTMRSSPLILSTELMRDDVMRKKSLAEIFGQFTIFADNFIGFIEYPKSSENMVQPKKLNAMLHYGYSGKTAPWIEELSREKVQIALEYLMTFLASQVFFHLQILQKPFLHYFKREVYSELQFFNEYVKKIAIEDGTQVAAKKPHSYYKAETDFVNKFMINKLQNLSNFNEVSDKYFLLAISKWFLNICELA